jgi:poly(beta-D-mannuronate) lyase
MVSCVETQKAARGCTDCSEAQETPAVCGEVAKRKVEGTCIADGKYKRIIRVGNSSQLAEALGHLKPGDAVVLQDGVYMTGGVEISGVQATAEMPVLIKAQHIGGVRWRGFLHIYNSEHVGIEGIVFDEALAKLPATESKVVRVHLKGSRHCRISRCILDFDESGISREESRYWLFLEAGKSNEVDHCRFGDKITKHAPLKVIYDEMAPFIHHNHFSLHSFAEGSNGYETLQMGAGSTGTHGRPMHALIEYNLFTDCDGEAEIISAKTSANIIRFNTFVDCRGKVVLRMSDDSQIYNNYFLNPAGKSNVGGIRIHGSRNDVFNNYFDGLTANVFETWAGDTDVSSGTEEANYRQSKDNRIIFNTAVNCTSHFFYFRKPNTQYSLSPKGWIVMNNLFVGTGSDMIGGTGEKEFIYENNVAYGTAVGQVPNLGRNFNDGQFLITNPRLVRCRDGLWRQQSDSPTIGSASPVPGLAYQGDMDKQPRDSAPDIGADEYVEAPIVHLPLAPADVGPFAE